MNNNANSKNNSNERLIAKRGHDIFIKKEEFFGNNKPKEKHYINSVSNIKRISISRQDLNLWKKKYNSEDVKKVKKAENSEGLLSFDQKDGFDPPEKDIIDMLVQNFRGAVQKIDKNTDSDHCFRTNLVDFCNELLKIFKTKY